MKKKRVIITIKEEYMSQADSLAHIIDEKGAKNIKVLSNIGMIIGSMDKQTMQAIENHPAIERMAEDQEVHML